MSSQLPSIWITGPERDRWSDAVATFLSDSFVCQSFDDWSDLPMRSYRNRTANPVVPEWILWAGDHHSPQPLIDWLALPNSLAPHRLYIAAGEWSDAELALLQRLSARLFVRRWTDLNLVKRALLVWPHQVSIESSSHETTTNFAT
ncbi:hypothetical protein [Rhodopirellula halodulae]|uniref:hypothetical protein n=1 Tax=Rhodopirellula halodulae TaxID=2894198 RepID=UPI001E3FDDDC|nr:hypothetical protein [Rhodopirellula sp. JC737]MCC9657886.1 hypothetical protein [Rhodopirellula sp. JC737]